MRKFLLLSGIFFTFGGVLAQAKVIAPEEKSASAEAQRDGTSRPPAPVVLRGADGRALPSVEDKLTLEDCIEIALANSPSAITAALAVQEAQIAVRQAQNVLLPTVTASANQGYTNHKTDGSPRTDHGSTDSSVDAILTISGITDIARTIKVQKMALEQVELNLDDVKNTLVKNVKRDYYALLSAKRAVAIRTKSRDLYQDQYDRAKAFFDNGLRPKVDVTTAEVNLNNEELSLIRAKNLVSSTSAQLANTLGVATPKILELDDNVEEAAFEIGFDEAVRTAYANRPDVRSAETDLEINRIKLNRAKAGYWPTFSFSAGFSKSGDEFYLDNEDTKLLASVQLPIFNAFKTYNDVKQARLSLEHTRNNNRSLLNNVFLEVQSAFIKMNEASESIPIARLNVQKASENLDLARGRYNEGIGDIIEMKDAEISYTDAELSYLTARYDYATAVAELKQAMGMR